MAKRPIVTYYYNGRDLVRSNRATRLLNAIANCTHHMERNSYGATSAEVIDLRSGKLYRQVRHHVTGNISILFKQALPPEELK